MKPVSGKQEDHCPGQVASPRSHHFITVSGDEYYLHERAILFGRVVGVLFQVKPPRSSTTSVVEFPISDRPEPGESFGATVRSNRALGTQIVTMPVERVF